MGFSFYYEKIYPTHTSPYTYLNFHRNPLYFIGLYSFLHDGHEYAHGELVYDILIHQAF